MREIIDIVAAFEGLCQQAKPAALATVIAVEGSAYRRPGARMLIAEDGRTWGGVSGGCLERDVANRGRGIIATGQAMIVQYDTTDDEQLGSGATTGCGGTIKILIQRVTGEAPGAIEFLRRAIDDRHTRRIATLVRTNDSAAKTIGSCVEIDTNDESLSGEEYLENYFIETIHPPQRLIVCGAGPDVVPVVAMAKLLGWHVSVVASNTYPDLQKRFAQADQLQITSADRPLGDIELDADAALVLMTHNLPRDTAILSAIKTPLRYLGILGPKRRTDELLAGFCDLAAPDAVFAPVGLDLGAETSEEIALSIIAEIQATLRLASAKPLRDRAGPIHPIDPKASNLRSTFKESVTCPL